MFPPKIFLIGMPGSGKSTFGRQLAKALDYPFFDLDEEIEKQQEITIKGIFERSGEDEFRKIESDCLKEFSNSTEQFVLSCGGGTPCFNDNMDFINHQGYSVFLNAPIDSLVVRLKKTQISVRPLVSKMVETDLKKSLEEQLKSRLSFYQLANLELDQTLPIEEIIDLIVA